ncbi:hypothetical protein P4361_00415 [Fictibacillus sp. B-59209]|uniref:hypothetical protein n=1 Tax=Fictibacillus sp. B-59209 TaxID=3024873 RepID=UPI002E1B06C4|nr:hypothetical protein [Fictibacillus sp. B-59209]
MKEKVERVKLLLSQNHKDDGRNVTHVVEVTESDGYKSYFARNIGFIKGTYKGKTITQLAKIKKK